VGDSEGRELGVEFTKIIYFILLRYSVSRYGYQLYSLSTRDRVESLVNVASVDLEALQFSSILNTSKVGCSSTSRCPYRAFGRHLRVQ
jgi:hypothetical protein